MIHFEVRWLHCGGFALQSLPSLPVPPPPLSSFFVLEKKAFVAELRRGLGHV